MESYLDNLAEFLVYSGILSFIILLVVGIVKLVQLILRALGYEETVINFLNNLFEDGNQN